MEGQTETTIQNVQPPPPYAPQPTPTGYGGYPGTYDKPSAPPIEMQAVPVQPVQMVQPIAVQPVQAVGFTQVQPIGMGVSSPSGVAGYSADGGSQPGVTVPTPAGAGRGTTVIVVKQYGGGRCVAAERIMMDGLFDCFDDCETCMCALLFPPCAQGMWVERAGMGSCCCSALCYLCICYWFWPCVPCYAGAQRSGLYRRLDMPDPGCCLNCLCHMFCSCCALSQEGRAAKKIEEMTMRR